MLGTLTSGVSWELTKVLERLPKKLMRERRFPAPWTIDALDGGFKVVDANKQSLAYVYGHATRVMRKLPRG